MSTVEITHLTHLTHLIEIYRDMSFGDNAQFAGGPPDSRRKQNVELWRSKSRIAASPAISISAPSAPLAYIFSMYVSGDTTLQPLGGSKGDHVLAFALASDQGAPSLHRARAFGHPARPLVNPEHTLARVAQTLVEQVYVETSLG